MDVKYFFENAIFSSKVNQPILCYGRLMARGWGIKGREQTLEKGDLKVPLNLQKNPLTVQGRVRVIRYEGPTVIPEVEDSPELMSTTLVKREGRWLMPEYCESTMKKDELDEQFFDDDAVIPSEDMVFALKEEVSLKISIFRICLVAGSLSLV